MSPDDVARLLDRKIDVCFGHGDQNGDGVIELADALALAGRILAYLREPFNSPKAQALLDSFETFWKYISSAFGAHADSKITPLEWRAIVKRAFVDDLSNFEAGFMPMAEAIWAICDRNDDGKIGPNEFAAFHKAFGTSPANSRISFEKLDRDSDGSLSVDELVEAWREFYTSADPEALGNWLFGDVWATTVWKGTRVAL
ncbi:EF-hand domain-containing protein [Streptomyces sp. SBT349]|uniref:EF-hand domain-containing protein n=1 Tax=Streptomyces sp. SBT349 TaxID=1580539 RepID=UPI0007C63953|nr:EF-hand domain-containing protein [Streptomyces sp. SBT349]